MFKRSPKYLPKPEGSFVTGCMDVMLDYSEEGILMRLYYPTKASQQEETKWISWFHGNEYLDGLAKAIYIQPFMINFAKWWCTGGKAYSPLRYGDKVNTDDKLKCIIFSHGYASSRFLNSIICNELASRGYLVAAIEHRDKSASYTYYYKSKEDAEKDIKTPIEVKKITLGKGNYDERNAQVNRRSDECSKVLDFLINLNNGEVPHNILDDVNSDHIFKLEDLVGHLDLDSITMAGHSFGGATALLTLSKRKELKQGVLFDPWMFPIKDEKSIVENVTQPLLFVNTQTFHIAPNIKMMEKFMTNDDRQMFTMLNSTHENQTDGVVVLGSWLNWFMKKIEPYLGLQINNALTLTFLKRYTHHTEDIEDYEKLLEVHKAVVIPGLTEAWA